MDQATGGRWDQLRRDLFSRLRKHSRAVANMEQGEPGALLIIRWLKEEIPIRKLKQLITKDAVSKVDPITGTTTPPWLVDKPPLNPKREFTPIYRKDSPF